jgi:hypothetical protein
MIKSTEETGRSYPPGRLNFASMFLQFGIDMVLTVINDIYVNDLDYLYHQG